MATVSVVESVRAAAEFARANIGRVAGVLALVFVLSMATDIAGRSAAGLLFAALGVVAGLMAQGALLRLALAPDHPGDPDFQVGPQGFQFGQPELRLFGAAMLLLLFFLIGFLLLLLLAFIFSIALYVSVHGQTAVPAVGAKLPPDVQAMLAALLLAFSAGALWVVVRVCLYPAATIAEKRIQVFSTWKLTAGSWWRIFAAVLIVALPAMAIGLLFSSTPGPPSLQLALAVLSAAINAFVELPLVCGLYAHLYRRLHGAAPPVLVRGAPVAPGLAGPWGSV